MKKAGALTPAFFMFGQWVPSFMTKLTQMNRPFEQAVVTD
jgi:hypothetical protein